MAVWKKFVLLGVIAVIVCLASVWSVKEAKKGTIDTIEIFRPRGFAADSTDKTFLVSDPDQMLAILFFFEEIEYRVPTSAFETPILKDGGQGPYQISFYHDNEPVRTYSLTVDMRPDCIRIREPEDRLDWEAWYVVEPGATEAWENMIAVLSESGLTDDEKAQLMNLAVEQFLDSDSVKDPDM